MADMPGWVTDAVFYQIFPDTWARSDKVPKPGHLAGWDDEPSHAFKGGDLWGIVEHLDYLTDLGITALYLNPVFASTANHRYHTYDYYRVDPILGGNEALRALLDAAHERGMRVILDGVFNHASRGFYQFNHTLENGADSPYLDWFTFDRQWLASGEPLNAYPSTKERQQHWQSGRGIERYGYECWWDLPGLPKFNVHHSPAREFLLDVAAHWIEFGADGWRLDVPMEIDEDAFWQTFRQRVKEVNPAAYLVGEIWEDAQRWLQGDQFDGVMNYELQRACLRYFGGADLADDLKWAGQQLSPWRAVRFMQEVEALQGKYDWPTWLCQLNLLGSHDVSRYLDQMGGNVARAKMSMLFLMTMPGAPCIYYGDEIGLRNAGRIGDGSRATMPWDESRWNADLRHYVQRCIQLRHAHPALRRGTFEKLYSNNQSNVLAYMRRLERELLIVVYNNGEANWELRIPVKDLFEGVQFADLFTGQEAVVRQRCVEGPIMRPQTGTILKAKL